MITFCSREKEVVDFLRTILGNEHSYLVRDCRNAEDLGKFDIYVSPSNSFGEIQGGIDMQYYLHFGKDELQNRIYHEIKTRYDGELLIGEFCPIQLGNGKVLLLCPTMTVPMNVSGTRNAYYFTRAMLKGLRILKKAGYTVDNVFCPIPCVGVGGMDYKVVARQMQDAFDLAKPTGKIMQIYEDYKCVLQKARMTCISQV